ncbi:hypothetical protein MMC25_000313 [Agyrium rufum]|nr:hypothetical protein [Agyrium rufum]
MSRTILPDDILHLICDQLWLMRDFNTLYSCALVSRSFALLAVAKLYRMQEIAPVTDRGRDEDVTRASKPIDNEKYLNGMFLKWACLWRSMILSTLGETMYPYSNYIRSLNFKDLEKLLEDSRCRGRARNNLFGGSLEQFDVANVIQDRSRHAAKHHSRLDNAPILAAVGEAMTKQTPMVEELAGDITAESLRSWIPRLQRLQFLSLWSGESLTGGLGKLINAHCPAFGALEFFSWNSTMVDEDMSTFLKDLQSNSLTSIQSYSRCEMGNQTFTALQTHCTSLRELKLGQVSTEIMMAMPLLNTCKNLETLSLTAYSITYDFETAAPNTIDKLILWLKSCKKLTNITLKQIRHATTLVTPVLMDPEIRLSSLELEGYKGRDAKDFHGALSNQTQLETLLLKGDSEDFLWDDMNFLVNSVSKLTTLTDLQLREISEGFMDSQVRPLVQPLSQLEELWISGYALTDAIFEDIKNLKQLRRLEILATSRFTVEGLLDYIEGLGSGNQGLILGIAVAEFEYSLSEEAESLVRESLFAKVEGRFDYAVGRDPNLVDEFSESDSD